MCVISASWIQSVFSPWGCSFTAYILSHQHTLLTWEAKCKVWLCQWKKQYLFSASQLFPYLHHGGILLVLACEMCCCNISLHFYWKKKSGKSYKRESVHFWPELCASMGGSGAGKHKHIKGQILNWCKSPMTSMEPCWFMTTEDLAPYSLWKKNPSVNKWLSLLPLKSLGDFTFNSIDTVRVWGISEAQPFGGWGPGYSNIIANQPDPFKFSLLTSQAGVCVSGLVVTPFPLESKLYHRGAGDK